VRFRYKLEGQDKDWREVVNDRLVQYSNLLPKHYRFRVIAANNSGVWNEQGATLDFVIPPAWYQTNWFRVLCVAALLALLWATYQLRLRQLAREFNMRLDEGGRTHAHRARAARYPAAEFPGADAQVTSGFEPAACTRKEGPFGPPGPWRSPASA